jgi:hypothetical protein
MPVNISFISRSDNAFPSGLTTAHLTVIRKTLVRPQARAQSPRSFALWRQHWLTVIADRYQELCIELEIAQVGVAATERHPALYAETEQAFWVWREAELSQRKATLEDVLRFLTRYEDAMALWMAVTQAGAHPRGTFTVSDNSYFLEEEGR